MPMGKKHIPEPQVASAAETSHRADERQNRSGSPIAQRVKHASDATQSSTMRTVHHSTNSRVSATGTSSQPDSRPTTRRIKADAKVHVGNKAKNMTVEQGASVTAISGGRATGNTINEVLAMSAKAKEFKEYLSNSSQMSTGLGGQADSRPTTRRTVDAKFGHKAKNMKVEQGAFVSATAGPRVIGNTVEEVLAMSDKAKEFEDGTGGDWRVDILGESVGATVRGEVEATAGVHMTVRGQTRGRDVGFALERSRASRK